jgi:signal transduction histidine kinase
MVLSPDDSPEGNPLQCVGDSNNALSNRSTYKETQVVERQTPENQAPPDLDWQPLRGPFTRWPRISDAVLVLVVLLITIGSWMSWVNGNSEVHLEGTAPAIAMILFLVGTIVLYWRRQKPLQVHATVLVVSALAMVPGFMYGPLPALMISLYSLGRYTENRRLGHFGLGAALVLVAVEEFITSEPAGDSIFSLLIVFVVWYVGRRMRIRGEYLRLLQERALHLEREQAAEAEKAVAEERTRIARELHDIVAHQVSLMTVQAGAAKTVAKQNPEAALQAMESVEKAGRQALNELRHLVSVLRPGNEGDGLGPQPGSADIPRLVEEVRAAGLEVSLDMSIRAVEFPARVDLSIYRIVQEALTNVIKHAGPQATAEVSISCDREGVAIEVRDNGGGATRLPGSGHGIVGMRERAQLLGGNLLASPLSGGGFKVVAYLPISKETL